MTGTLLQNLGCEWARDKARLGGLRYSGSKRSGVSGAPDFRKAQLVGGSMEKSKLS